MTQNMTFEGISLLDVRKKIKTPFSYSSPLPVNRLLASMKRVCNISSSATSMHNGLTPDFYSNHMYPHEKHTVVVFGWLLWSYVSYSTRTFKW